MLETKLEEGPEGVGEEEASAPLCVSSDMDSKPMDMRERRSSDLTNNISINEFRDTIGICKVVSAHHEEGGGNDFGDGDRANIVCRSNWSGTHQDGAHAHVLQDGNKSITLLNLEITDILLDLDSVLDNSLVAPGDTGEEGGREDEPTSIDASEAEQTGIGSNNGHLGVENVPENWCNEPEIYLNCSMTERDQKTKPLDSSSVHVEDATQRERGNKPTDMDRRRSMRLTSPVDIPSAPSLPPLPCPQRVAPVELSLSAQLFLENQDPERYGELRPTSASAAPRERGRRALPPRRCASLHVRPRADQEPLRHSEPFLLATAPAPSPLHMACAFFTPDEEHQDEPSTIPHETSTEDEEVDEDVEGKEKWATRGSCALSVLSCTLSGYSICRFSLFTLHFGANFIVQFLLLSLLFGIPLLCLFCSLGHALNAGPLGSWRVSPLFLGLGAALLLSQVFLAAYYVAGLSWLLVYLRDSFVSQNGLYRWADPFSSSEAPGNRTALLPLYVPAYLSEVVLRRSESPTLPFQSLFHTCVLWAAVAVILSKGLTSHGKVIFVTTLAPLLFLCAVAIRFLFVSSSGMRGVLPYANWGEFFINSKCWSAAAGECFMTWALLAPTVWSLCGSPAKRHPPNRSIFITLWPCLLLTCVALICGIIITGACATVIAESHLYYATSSYERPTWWVFLTHERSSYPRHATHHSSLLGISVARAGSDPSLVSGLQPLRLATELFPAAVALVSTSRLSCFWAVLFYLSLVMLGISQLCTITWAITASLIETCPPALRARRGIISLACCATLLLASLPLARGLELVHLLDYAVVGIWWQCMLQVITVAAFFLVRGRPYAADALAATCFSSKSMFAPLLAFTWNVVLPVAMIVECVVDFRVGKYKDITGSHQSVGYWGGGARAAIALLQLLPPLLVPLLALVQCCRYLSKGPPDILDRIQLLYRPLLDSRGRVMRVREPAPPRAPPAPAPPATTEPPPAPEDPPPKYTPPPSYSTATGARIAKFLTSSIRRSIRRVRKRVAGPSVGESRPSSVVALQMRSMYRSFRERKSAGAREEHSLREACTLPRTLRGTTGMAAQDEEEARGNHSSPL